MNLIVRLMRSVTFPTTIRWTTKKTIVTSKKHVEELKLFEYHFWELNICVIAIQSVIMTTTALQQQQQQQQQPFHNSRATQSTQTIQCRKLSYWIFFLNFLFLYSIIFTKKSAASSMVLKGNCLIKKTFFYDLRLKHKQL